MNWDFEESIYIYETASTSRKKRNTGEKTELKVTEHPEFPMRIIRIIKIAVEVNHRKMYVREYEIVKMQRVHQGGLHQEKKYNTKKRSIRVFLLSSDWVRSN